VPAVLRAAVAAFCVCAALVAGGAATGARTYTGPVAGVPWSPASLSDAAVGVPYSATITASPPGAVQVAVVCNTKDLGAAFPPPPIALDSCGSLPPGLHATAGASLTIAGKPTTEGSYSFRLMAVWTDATGADFYALQTFGLTVATTSASPPCHCASIGVKVTKVSFAGATASLSALISLECSGGSGHACKGTATLTPPAGGVWTGLQRPGDDAPQPVAKGTATVAVSCYAPCGAGATLPVRLLLGHAPRRGSWKITVKSACAGGDRRTRTLVVRVR
jgi:hypothetical protein